MNDHARTWARYQRSDGGADWVSYWYKGDLDVFEYDGVTYTRIGPVVWAWTIERARELLTTEARDASLRSLRGPRRALPALPR